MKLYLANYGQYGVAIVLADNEEEATRILLADDPEAYAPKWKVFDVAHGAVIRCEGEREALS